MFSLSTLGFVIGGALLYMSKRSATHIDEANWQVAVDTVRTERVAYDPGTKVSGKDCNRIYCNHHSRFGCQKPWNDYCGYE